MVPLFYTSMSDLNELTVRLEDTLLFSVYMVRLTYVQVPRDRSLGRRLKITVTARLTFPVSFRRRHSRNMSYFPTL